MCSKDLGEDVLEIVCEKVRPPLCLTCAHSLHFQCDSPYHLKCLKPPLKEVPEGEWFCERCLAEAESDDGPWFKVAKGGGTTKASTKKAAAASSTKKRKGAVDDYADDGGDDAYESGKSSTPRAGVYVTDTT